MKLVGMLDSPFVRRVAISLQLLGLRFEHQSLSVFRTFDEFRQINPAVKAPTLVCDDGELLMDSTLILDYAEALARPRTLMPSTLHDRQHDLRLIGLALAVCEKSGQLIYERGLRPPEKQHAPWVDRVTAQLLGACGALEQALAARPIEVSTSAALRQAGVSVAVAWHFAQRTLPQVVPAAGFPHLVALSAAAEALPEFRAAPYGEGTCRPVEAPPAPAMADGRDLQIRSPLSPDEIEAARVLLDANGWGPRVADPSVFAELLRRSPICLVAVRDGQVIGFLRALSDGLFNSYISMVVVDEAHRGQGVGSRLVRTAMGTNPEMTWVLRAGRGGVSAFYKALGFQRSEVAMERPGRRP
ncbi:GNAT family N-acetyltransferase [Ideonella sp. A 288]|uniref:GNAT family N-acetyltransferase n=1 Tax=Ideonella sp. A 288 TaxID=1962181 RepID=UPI000B4BB88B|nr:GNAT family N-acetyltransferase [Ideonella sp. A 288]